MVWDIGLSYVWHQAIDRINQCRLIAKQTKILIHSQTTTSAQLKFGNEYVISFHTLLGVWLRIHAEIKVKTC